MMTTYAFQPAVPLDGHLVAAFGLGAVGWAALTALAVGIVALLALAVRERLDRAGVPGPDAARHEVPLAA
jgi:hypothetical protein